MTTAPGTGGEDPGLPLHGAVEAKDPDAGVPWQRVHFISPLVRGWIALVAILYFVGRDWFEGLFDAGSRARGPLPEGVGLLLAGGVVLGVVLLIAAGFFVAWYFTRYQVTAEHVRVHSGVIFRQQRQARLDRVQAIDIVQPLLARIFGLAELKFEVADAGESAVRLAFLKLDDATRLRATILARAAGVETDPEHPEDIVEAPEREVVALRPGRVIGAAVLSGATVVLLVAAIAVFVLGVVLGTAIVATSFIPILIGVGGAYWSALGTGYNFRAATSPDGIRMRYGLLDTRAQTVPPGRVQALSIVQSPLWRLKGWYRVSVNVAGYGAAASSEGQARATLLPVGTREEVLQILALVLPDPGTERPVELFSAGMTGRDGYEGFVTTPRRARWLAPLAWRRNGFAVTSTALLMRSGVLWRQLVVVPHERTQSLSIEQGPLDRRFRVSTLQFQTTPGPVSPRVHQTDSDAAWDLFHGQAARAAEARRRSAPEQWMKPLVVRQPAAPGTAPMPAGLPADAVPTTGTLSATDTLPTTDALPATGERPAQPGVREIMPEVPSYVPAPPVGGPADAPR
ncbi:PH domain-containing protein [Arthrobacter echini]|uniref:PH domain-containing protein n=1 Tax=Arthrobacter echini TaxID=1529066 RepID=A0A5D0XV91_9MICC|nr:PH domain-containing protein [Arthrobacter echini]TYD00638.1 PH domain-containing protein [Arthrobacter echini]